jgi:hypothetical protein
MPQSLEESPPERWWICTLLAGVALYLILAGGISYTKRPWTDEAWYINIAVSELTSGNTGISVLEPKGDANVWGEELPQIDKYFYLWMPTQPTFQAAWIRIFGFGVLSMRFGTMFWGLAGLGAWFVIVMKLSGDKMAAAIAVVLIGSDYVFVNSASDGRMDMMCAALWFLGLAAYLGLRERRLGLAVACSQALVVLSVLTHPIGMVGFAATGLVILYLDSRRLKFSHILLAAAIYLCGAGLIALYVLPHLDVFRAQFPLAVGRTHRMGALHAPLQTFLQEFTRKMRGFYFPEYATSWVSRLRVLIPMIYGAVFLAACISRKIRNKMRILLLFTAVCFVLMALYDSAKLYYYLVHSIPPFIAVTAMWLRESRKQRTLPVPVLGAVAGALLLLNITWASVGIRRDSYHKSFLPMTSFLTAHLCPACTVTGSGEIGFVMGFNGQLKDDALLGYYSGRHPDMIVTDEIAYDAHFQGYARNLPEVSTYVNRLLAEDYRKIFDNGYYRIYARASRNP